MNRKESVIKFNQYFNENKTNKEKTILNLIFSDDEISELYKIKEEISINYLKDLEIDSFSNQDDDSLLNFIEVSLNKKDISIDEYDMKIILKLVNNNIRI